MKKKSLTFLKFVLGWPFSIVALFFIFKTFLPKLNEVQSHISQINIFLLTLGILLFIGYYYLRSFLWYKILVFFGYPLDVKHSLFLWSSAQLRRYIPGNIWGFLSVTLGFETKNVKKRDIAKAILIESELVILTALLLSLLALKFFWTKMLTFDISYEIIYRLLLIGVSILIIGYLLSPIIIKKINHKYIAKLQHILPPFACDKTLFLFLIMLVSYLFLGAGYYFTLSAVIPLPPSEFFVLIGIFISSLLIGYLSLVTPTGLGVREGAMAISLSHFVLLPLAGFTALFGRIILVFSELIFVGIAYLIANTKNKTVLYLLKFLSKYPYEIVLFLLFAAYTTYFSTISILRYEHYYTGRFDLGNMAQTVWNTLHGRFFEFTNPDGTEIVSRLAFHADFLLVLLTPFYLIWEDPRMLLLIQTIVVAAGAFFVYAIANKILNNKALALTFAFIYLINPSVQRANIYDFHAVTLATTFLLGAFYFLYKKQYVFFMLFAFLSGITKEQIWAIIALFGIYVFLIQKRRKLGIAVFSISAFLFYFLIWHAIPSASDGSHFALSYYSEAGEIDSPSQLLKGFLTNPTKTYSLLTTEPRINYLHSLFKPLGYLSLFSPLYLIFAVPDLSINLLSRKPQLYQIYYQYTSAITPFLFIAAIFSVSFIKKRWQSLPNSVIIIYSLLLSIYSAYLYGPLPGSREPNLDMLTKPFENKKNVDAFLASIPTNASVSASNSIGSHLAHRRYLYTLPQGWDQADYVIFNLDDPNTMPSLSANKAMLVDLIQRGYIKIYDDGKILGLKKNTSLQF